MAYQDIDFPVLALLDGFEEQREKPTTIVGNYTREYRLNRYANAKRTFVYPGRKIRESTWQALVTFLETVGYERDSFNFTTPRGETVVVRFDGIPSASIATLTSANAPSTVEVSNIVLKEVFGED